jgi:hypothetical protein
MSPDDDTPQEPGTGEEPEAEEPTADAPAAEVELTADVPAADIEPAAGAAPATRAPRTTGGQTLRDRFLTPVVLPVAATVAIVFVVLNLSRVFLAGTGGGHGGEEGAAEAGGHAAMPVVFAAVVTIAILLFATVLAQARRMRTQTLAVFSVVALAVVSFAGWLSVGDAQEPEEGGGPVACDPPTNTLEVLGLNALRFDKDEYRIGDDCLEITFGGDSGHTFVFDTPNPPFPKLSSGQSAAAEVPPGEYVVYCDVGTHRAAGMEAVLIVEEPGV